MTPKEALEPRRSFDLVRHEIAQRRETGHDTAAIEERFAAVSVEDDETLAALYRELLGLPPPTDWGYGEPSDLVSILASLPHDDGGAPRTVDDPADRILGGWLGRIVGCNLGKPVEAERWTSGLLRTYLELAEAYPLLDYIPALDPMPDGFEFRESWPETTRGNIDGSARDDDIDYSIMGLHLLETHGSALTRGDAGRAWTSMLPYQQLYTAERAAYRNLVAGVPLDEVATFENPYREWIGAQIRGDVFGWVHPGRPRRAAVVAFEDASLSHTANGIFGEMWVAALCAEAFVAETMPEAVAASLDHIPARSRLAEAIGGVLELYRSGATWDDALAHIQERFGHYFIVHTVNNAAIVTAGLLWGDHDFASIVGLTVQGGWDTDSNGATAGSVAGVFLGSRQIPDRFVEPLHDRVRSAVVGFDQSRISDLAERTAALADRM
ncbi:MAG TPA: ADP-ribosylglycohydrolase family protein [Acidimicrobiia bacterium]|nr:ADP-ribosylglycohydrolase family protein [Acidimicrobiia bacterium]